MALTKAQLEALKNSLLASGQPITAATHRGFIQNVIDEMYDAQSRGNLLAGVQANGTTVADDTILLIRGGQAYLVPATLFGTSAGTLGGLTDVVIVDPEDDDIITYDAATSQWVNISLAGVYVTQVELTAALDNLLLPSGARLVSANLVLTSDTAGNITAQWVDFNGQTESVTAEALAFNAGGLPAAGNFRFDIVQGNNAGTVSVKEGTEAVAASVVIPTPDASNVLLAVGLWTEDGDGEVTQPGGDPLQNDFSIIRLATALAPNTTGKFAKVWEGALSADANYSLSINYAEPKNATSFVGSGMQLLNLSFSVNASRVIIADTVKITTGLGSTAGEFVLYQIAGQRAALYHKSNQYWGRIQYRVLFQNNQILLSDLTNLAPYAAAPTVLATYPSIVEGSGVVVSSVSGTGVDNTDPSEPIIDLYVDFVASTGSILFDVPRKYGFTTALTAALTVGTAGAFESNMAKVRHNHSAAPTISVPGGVTLVNDGGTYVINVDNIYYFICHKNDAGTVNRVSYTITQNQT